MMIKPAFLFGMLLLGCNALAVSVSDLNSALHNARPKTPSNLTKILYGGSDILHPQVADPYQAIYQSAQTHAG